MKKIKKLFLLTASILSFSFSGFTMDHENPKEPSDNDFRRLIQAECLSFPHSLWTKEFKSNNQAEYLHSIECARQTLPFLGCFSKTDVPYMVRIFQVTKEECQKLNIWPFIQAFQIKVLLNHNFSISPFFMEIYACSSETDKPEMRKNIIQALAYAFPFYADDRTDLIVRLADRLSDPALKEDLLSMLAEAKSLISQDPKQYAEMMDSLERRKLQKSPDGSSKSIF